MKRSSIFRHRFIRAWALSAMCFPHTYRLTIDHVVTENHKVCLPPEQTMFFIASSLG